MKILVASDSHGTASGLAEAVEREKPELLLHLGDGISDLISLQIWYPHLLVKQVRGNCDLLEDGLAEQTLLIEGHRILMFHGHTKGVKRGLVKARLAAANPVVWAYPPAAVSNGRRTPYFKPRQYRRYQTIDLWGFGAEKIFHIMPHYEQLSLRYKVDSGKERAGKPRP